MNEKSASGEWEVGLIGGVEKRTIVLVPYRREWVDEFEARRRTIADALGPVAVGIQNIGSTSVPGLAAKPIIDILLIVPDSAAEDTYLPQLNACGYQLRVREPEFEEHRMLRTPEKDVHIHVLSAGSQEVQRCLLFRDQLRCDDGDRDRYQALKSRLAEQDWEDMNAYAQAKGEFIEETIAKARTR
jgi:GrpB-like predicted nucleotidyltransferase (UPF0157 family)